MTLRDDQLALLKNGDLLDVLIVGGGINGAVTAASLAARGPKVALVDRGDFAGFTSSSSSNLAWGGIKYLETWEFGLVWKLCRSRNHLLRHLPSQVKEARFFVAHEKKFRHPLWFLMSGALFYWCMGLLFTRAPRWLTTKTMNADEPVVDTTTLDGGFEYSDAYLPDNDARFTWSFIKSALNNGCRTANYVESVGATFDAAADNGRGLWTARLKDVRSGEEFVVVTRSIVNAAGPMVDAHNTMLGMTGAHRHVFSKGIHLIVPRITQSKRVLTFFADDGRLFFVIPMGHRTCVGTTDTRVDDPNAVVTDDDRDFVLSNINKRLRLTKPLTVADVISERCGVRPLVVKANKTGTSSDWFALSRKHEIEVDSRRRHVSIFGGKLTDCINVGEELAALKDDLGLTFTTPKARWYGEPGDDVKSAFVARARGLIAKHGAAATIDGEDIPERLWRRYNSDGDAMLDEIEADPRALQPIIPGGPDLRCEARFAGRTEMVTTLMDYLRRRTKLALTIGTAEIAASSALPELCALLFGADADAQREAFLRATSQQMPSPVDVVPAPRSLAS